MRIGYDKYYACEIRDSCIHFMDHLGDLVLMKITRISGKR
jgi:hypothetical protein